MEIICKFPLYSLIAYPFGFIFISRIQKRKNKKLLKPYIESKFVNYTYFIGNYSRIRYSLILLLHSIYISIIIHLFVVSHQIQWANLCLLLLRSYVRFWIEYLNKTYIYVYSRESHWYNSNNENVWISKVITTE